jgi:formylglycine-generating enzyme required for sulfatase activity
MTALMLLGLGGWYLHHQGQIETGAEQAGAAARAKASPALIPEMVRVRAGSFLMGCQVGEKECESHEKPPHRVQVPTFDLGKYEVTFAEWDACVADGGCTHKPRDEGWGRARRPVVNVSWDDVQQYVAWLSRKTGQIWRLPSEAEWEYAARAGTSTAFSTGNCIHTDQANYAGTGSDYAGCCAKTGVYPGKTQPVGSYPGNPWGLHDLHGNAWEWVEDCGHADYGGAPSDGSAWTGSCHKENNGEMFRVLRGGSWNSIPDVCRAAYRAFNTSDNRHYYNGFRVVRVVSARTP